MDNNENGQAPLGSEGAGGAPASTPAPSGSSTPLSGGQPGSQTDPRDEKIKTLENEVRSLNKAVIDSRRASRQNGKSPDGQESPFDTPEGQYAASLEIAGAKLGRSLESIFKLYPEVPAEDVARVRANPWAFASHQSYVSGDYETAALEVEQALLERAEAIAAGKTETTPPGGKTVTPASVNANPNPESAGEPAAPGTVGDEDPWTMPLADLEKLKNKAVAELAKAS